MPPCVPGGHTTEMLRLMGSLSAVYSPRLYVLAETDGMSEEKICAFERCRKQEDSQVEPERTCMCVCLSVCATNRVVCQFFIHRIPRSREVNESWSSSVLSSLNALSCSVPLVFRLQPDMVSVSH